MDDDDEEEQNKQPTKYEFSEESKLDEDHLFYLQFTNNFISNVTRPRDFDHCSRWLERLAGEPMYGVEAKRNRNMYLAKLLIAMQDNKVKGPFSSFPPPGPLPNAAVAFGLSSPDEEETGSMMSDVIDRELNLDDYKYLSKDGRTYLATCALPNCSGALAFVGLSFGGGEGLWLNKDGIQVPHKSEDRIPVVTTDTPLKKRIELMEQPNDFDKKLPEEAFKFLTDLPTSSSDCNLLEVGNYKFSKGNKDKLLEEYSDEFVDNLEMYLVVSKKEIERRFRLRHDKLVKDMYKDFSKEIERGLQEYKEARQEWANVYQVVAELKETIAEIEAKESIKNQDFATATNRPTAVLSNSLNDAKKRQKIGYEIGNTLDATKVSLHKDIHERALFHMHEVDNLQTHVDKLSSEICALRRDARKKQMVIQSLYMQLGKSNT